MKYRVSHLEAFRRFESDDDMSFDDLMKCIHGIVSSAQMQAGTAFHRALELSPAGVSVSTLECDGYCFRFADDFEIELPYVRELRSSKTWNVDGAPITISGCVDAISGLRIDDHKTTGRFDPERYFEGCQWKLYSNIFGTKEFRWNIFELHERSARTYDVVSVHQISQYAYPGMEDDCTAIVSRFAHFAREHL